MEEKRKTEQISFTKELRSLYFGMINIVFNQTAYMEDEYEFATWRRVVLTIFIGILGMVIATQIARITVFVVYSIPFPFEYITLVNELFNRFWELGLGFVVTFILVIITGYVAHLWFASGDDETAYPFVSYVQIIAIVKALQAIFASLFIKISSLMLIFSSLGSRRASLSPYIPVALLIIGLTIFAYLYYVLSRALFIQTDLRGRTFWLRFILIIIWYEGLGYVLSNWIVPTVLELL
jgi:hypothetical protein